MVGGRLLSDVDPFNDAPGLEAGEHVVDRSPLGQRLDLIGDAAGDFDRLTGREFPRCEFAALSHGALDFF